MGFNSGFKGLNNKKTQQDDGRDFTLDNEIHHQGSRPLAILTIQTTTYHLLLSASLALFSSSFSS
jgi:hypothetical protein